MTSHPKPEPIVTMPPEPEPIVTLATREVYRNPWISVREDQVRHANGHEGIYGVVTSSPCVGILPFVDDSHVVLVRQYRYVIGRPTWEMPSGSVNPGESAAAAANRELSEESGYRADRLELVSTFNTSKSVVDEEARLFLAFDLTPTVPEPDETEQISTAVFSFPDVLRMVRGGEIVDSMTIIAVLLAADRRGR